MTVNNFPPTLWPGRALANLNDAHFYANALNLDYEVVINSIEDRLRILIIRRVLFRSSCTCSQRRRWRGRHGR